jgi:hypothetical protein
MRRHPLLTLAAYFICLLVVAIPLENNLAEMLYHGRQLPWRFGSPGFVVRNLLLPFFGILLASVTSFFCEHRRVQRIVAIIWIVAAALLLIGAGLFVLDAVQVRGYVAAERKGDVDRFAMIALAKYCVLGVVSLLMARAGWKASREKTSSASSGA